MRAAAPLPPASPPAPVAAWLLRELLWYVRRNSPALCYLWASARAGCPAAFAVWMRDRLWTRAVSGWIDPSAPGGRWSWVAEHPCWLERVTLSLAPEDGCTRQMTLWHTLPTPLERGHRLTFWMDQGCLRFDLGEGLEAEALPGPVALRLVEIRYRRRLP